MRIIITGGTGLIGSALTKQLTQNGYQVIVLSRNPSKYTFPQGATGAKWDAKSVEQLIPLFAEPIDGVIHLLGENIAGNGLLPTRWTDERKKRIIDSRVDSGKALTEAIRQAEHKPSVFLQSSAVGYYGTHEGDYAFDESMPSGNDFLADVCVQWEDSTAMLEEIGIRRVILRTGVVLDMEGGALPSLVMPYKYFIVGGPVGSGEQWIPWIHHEDEVRAIAYLLENETAVGAYNLSAPNPVTNDQMGKLIANELGRFHFLPIPAFAMKLAFGDVSKVVLEGQKAIPKRLEESGFTFNYPTIQPALQELLK